MSVTVTPVQDQDRNESIDVLRGFALLGILIMNIQSFSMVSAAYTDPSQHGDLTGVNWWVWALSHALADMKFMGLFSMLFGAGIVLATQSRQARGLSTFGHFYLRNVWLLIFGLIHAYLIWYGDILVTYAIAGFVLYWMRNLRAKWLFAIGAVVVAIPLLAPLTLLGAPPEVVSDVAKDFYYSEAELLQEILAYRGDWFDAHAARAQGAQDMHLFAVPSFLFWRAAGMMLLGMGLYKVGILSAQRSARFYARLAVTGFAVGVPLVSLSVMKLTAADYDAFYTLVGPGLAYNYLGSIAMALAYVGVVMLWAQSDVLASIRKRLAAVGRTAFSNYIMQSVICTFIFYGFGLGLFGHVDRWGQVLIVVAIWVLQLMIAPWWLARFRFGPLEWLWRSLTYRRAQPMRRRASETT